MRRVGSQVQTVGVQSLRNQHLMHTLESKVSGWYLLTCKNMESPDTGQVWLQCPGCLLLLSHNLSHRRGHVTHGQNLSHDRDF